MSGFVVKAKRFDGRGETMTFPNMSKNSDIKDLQAKIAESSLAIPIKKQRLFIGGREAKPKDQKGHKYTLFDYGIQHMMVVSVMERVELAQKNGSPPAEKKAKVEETEEKPKTEEEEEEEEEKTGEEEKTEEKTEREPTPVFEEREPDEPMEEKKKGEKADGAEEKEGASSSTTTFTTLDGEKFEVPEEKDALPWCDKCKDNPEKKCKACACQICHEKGNDDQTMLCDECEFCYHIYCLDPPLEAVPEDDWFCPDCANDRSEIVGAGDDLKGSRKRKRGVSTKCRDWGRGNATASVEKRTDVDKAHIGSIPDVDVGQTWIFRTDCAGSGVHRPPVSGMHSKGTVCFSIVASHGYEDDADQGDELVYTGEGGRDLSGNKRTNEQSKDQEWKKANLALAHSCAVKFNPEGGDAGDKWAKGKPVRLVRGNKNKKASQKQAKRAAANKAKLVESAATVEFLPPIPDLPNVKQIFRYDGTYKVVRYWREKGDSGFLICRFLLRRDDETPAPWTKEGAELIKQKGLSLKLPDGTIHCTGSYTIPAETLALIALDELNAAAWKDVVAEAGKGKTLFLEKVRSDFICNYCLDPMREPVSLGCPGRHLLCAACVKSTAKSMGHVKCESCKSDKLDIEDGVTIYEPLKNALAAII